VTIEISVGNEGAKKIAELIESNSSLLELYLGENRIGSIGARWIAQAIKKNFALRRIQFNDPSGDHYYNEIGDGGVKWFTEAIRTLQFLYLGHNERMPLWKKTG
jgi:Ran GTPase-activating protein (RanGAP) involved in mRNA processing and transport